MHTGDGRPAADPLGLPHTPARRRRGLSSSVVTWLALVAYLLLHSRIRADRSAPSVCSGPPLKTTCGSAWSPMMSVSSLSRSFSVGFGPTTSRRSETPLRSFGGRRVGAVAPDG